MFVTQDLIDNLRYNQREQAGQSGKHVLGVDREMQDILTYALAFNEVNLMLLTLVMNIIMRSSQQFNNR